MLQPKWLIALAAIAFLSVSASMWAQAPAGGGQQRQGRQAGQGGPGGGGRNFDPAQFRQMQLDRIKTQLGAPDDEWKVIQPKIEAVMTAQQNTRGGGGGPQRPGADQAPPANETEVQKTSRELRAVVENKNPSADEEKQKLTAYREARAAAKAKLTEAQKALQEVLTAHQEAVLVAQGMLD